MSSKTAVTVPAGWYADPVEVAASGMATQRRWWDGANWTHHVAALPTPVSPDVSSATVAAVTAATTAATGSSRRAGTPIASSATVGLAPATVSPSDSARAAESMPLHSVTAHPGRGGASATTTATSMATTKPAAHPSHAETVAYEPFHLRNRLSAPHLGSRSSRNPLHLRVHTVSVWLIAAMPITQALLVFWVFSTLPAEGLDWTRVLALVFPLVLTAALAGQDTRLLIADGHQRTAPWISALIAPPVYLAVRGLRVMRTTGAVPWPLVAWLVAQLAVFGVWFAVDPAAVESLVSALR